MYYIIKCTVQGKQARVKNADLRHPSCSCNVKTQICVTLPQCVKIQNRTHYQNVNFSVNLCSFWRILSCCQNFYLHVSIVELQVNGFVEGS